MQTILGVLTFAIGSVAALGFGVWSTWLCVALVREVGGLWQAVVAAVLFPVTLAVVPWYAALARGDWTPLLVGWGGGLVALLVFGVGAALTVAHLGSNSWFGKPRRKLFFWQSAD